MSILFYLQVCLHARAIALAIFTPKPITLPSQAICWQAPQKMADSEKIDSWIFTLRSEGGGAELLNPQNRVSNKKRSNTHPKKNFIEACYRLALQPYIHVRIGIGVGGVSHNILTCLETEENCRQQRLSRHYSVVGREWIGGMGGGQKICNNFRNCLPVKRLDYVQTLIPCLPCSTNSVDGIVFLLLCPIV